MTGRLVIAFGSFIYRSATLIGTRFNRRPIPGWAMLILILSNVIQLHAITLWSDSGATLIYHSGAGQDVLKECGFAIWGPANSATNPITQGVAVVQVYSPLSVAQSPGNANLIFPTVINHDYTVQFRTNLTDTAWSNLSTNHGSGTTMTVPDATTGSNQRFYRLKIK